MAAAAAVAITMGMKVIDGEGSEDEDEEDNVKRVKVTKGRKCPYCKKSLPTEEHLVRHLERFHSMDVTNKRYE